MGMPVGVDIPDAKSNSVFDKIHTFLKDYDEQFSTYKTTSEVSRFTNGEIDKKSISKKLKAVIAECNKFEAETKGYFSPYYDKAFDPSGYTKSLAIQEVARIINRSKYKTFMINMGGDIYVQSDGAKTWNLGIQNPFDKSDTIGTCSIKDGAVATSGNYERGSHILDPHTHQPNNELMSVTVVGPDIIEADVYATTLIAMGKSLGDEFMADKTDYQVIAIDKNAQIHHINSAN